LAWSVQTTVLHQYQRQIKTETRDGETLEYIEATEEEHRIVVVPERAARANGNGMHAQAVK